MRVFDDIYRAAVVVMTFCALFMVSCQRPATESAALEVSVKTPVVDSGKGQMFVNVKCDGRWTLALTDAVDGKDVDWASLSVTSGSDNKSNVVLSYQVNASEQSRKLDIVLDDGLHWVACSVEQMGSGKQPEPEPDPEPDPDPEPELLPPLAFVPPLLPLEPELPPLETSDPVPSVESSPKKSEKSLPPV